MVSFQMKWVGIIALAGVLGACAQVPEKKSEPVETKPVCQPAAAGGAMSGNWLGARKASGMTGELKVWLQLKPDGTMVYSEQLQRKRKPPQTLSEDGCWRIDGQALVLQTLNSNGVPVELDDPIYTNRYNIVSQAQRNMRLRGIEGEFSVGRMPDNYRLPF